MQLGASDKCLECTVHVCQCQTSSVQFSAFEFKSYVLPGDSYTKKPVSAKVWLTTTKYFQPRS